MPQIAQSITLISIKPSFPSLVFLTHKFNPKTRLQNHLISAKWGKRRSGSLRSRKLILNSITHIASSFKILPEPWDSLMKQLWIVGGGNGGNFGFRNGFGGGGGGRRRKMEKLGFWVLLLISSSLALWVVLEKGKDTELGFWAILVCISAFAVFCLLKGWKREIKDWVLGFSCGAALMGLGLRNNESFVKWVDGFRSNSSSFLAITKKRRRSRRWT